MVDFDTDTIQQVADSLWRPWGTIPEPTPNAVPEATIPTPPFVFGAKSHKLVLVQCEIVIYYETTGQGITTASVLWKKLIKDVVAQWKVLKELKKGRRARHPQDHQFPASNQVDPVILGLPRQDHRASHHPLILRRPRRCNRTSSRTTHGSRPATIRRPWIRRDRARG